MGGIKDLFANEKGIFAVLIIIAATILTAIGQMTIADWKTMATAIFGLYAGATALHTSVQAFSTRHKPPVAPPAFPRAPTPVPVPASEVKS